MEPAALAGSDQSPRVTDVRRPFSNFEFVEKEFGFDHSSDGIAASVVIRRHFSEARRHGAKTLLVEEIKPEGVLAAENRHIRRYFPDDHIGGLRRLSFWTRYFQNAASIAELDSHHLVGYLIAKEDIVPSKGVAQWHIFESVFRKYAHINNCVPNQPAYRVKVANKVFEICGVLYGQQNG